MNLLKLILKRPTIVAVMFIILVGFGLISYSKLNQELFPQMEMSTLTVTAVYPGAGPSEVESSVSRKIEDAVASLENIDNINTTSMEGFSYIIAEFKEGTDMDIIAQKAQRKVNAIRGELPETAMEPSVDIFDMNEMAIMNLSVTANVDETALYDLVENEIRPLIERIPGIARIGLAGGREREIQVNVDEGRLAVYGLTISEVSNVLMASNTDFPGGKINDGDKQILVRLSGKYQSTDDIANTVLKSFPDGSAIKVSDVAFVTDGQKDVSSIFRFNGKNAVGISVQKQPDANAVNVSEAVKTAVGKIEKQHSNINLAFQVAYDSSDFTVAATNSVIKDLLMAIVFVALSMLLFLHSFRNSLIVMISIPASLIATFVVMYLAGCTFNLMTLMALSLVIGILVDDAIVVIENIHRHLEMGKSKREASIDGLKEIGGSVFSLTMVLAVVFIPVSMTGGMMGGFLRQFSIVVASSTLVSLLVAVTIIPLLSSRYGKLQAINTESIVGKFVLWFESMISGFALHMRNLLVWSFNHKLIAFGVTLLLFVSSLGLFTGGFIGSEFMNAGDKGEFFVYLKLPKDATIEQTNQLTLQAEEILKQDPLIVDYYSTTGTEENGAVQSHKSEIHVKMVPYDMRNVREDEHARQTKLLLQRHIVGAEITSAPSAIFGGADDAPVQFYLMGTNMDTIFSASSTIVEELSGIKGLSDLKVSVEAGNPEISIRLNREKMARLGVSQYALGEALNNAFTGNTDTKFRDNDREYDIDVRLDKFDRKGKVDVENFSVSNASGEKVKLKQIASIEDGETPSRLERHNRITSLLVSAQVTGRPSGDAGADVKAAIEKLHLPPTVTVEYAGDMKNQDEGFGDLGLAMTISLALVYLIMVLLYNSYLHPFVVLVSIPLAVIGVSFTLGLTMSSLSIISMIGMIILIGLVTRNAILVVDFTNQQREKGVTVKEALLQATQQRFRPVLMTTIATIVGMLPIALAKGAGAEWKNSMGWVLIGGLTSSMLLTLVIVPLVYYLMDKASMKFGRNKKTTVGIEDK
ncbi:MAG: efflux RND transporter permease subunit [Tannerella sp.]|jgi:HAE1 family hydrophobic/amphiphilic exporter-1|nr:efflux RND transporter permease subunit [Tannerella sp.]